MRLTINSDIVTTSFKNIEFEELIDDLVKAAQSANYRITTILDLTKINGQKSFKEKFDARFKHYKIVEICNLTNCNRLISSDLRIGVFMPARFAASQSAGDAAVHVSYLKPSAFARQFESDKVMKLAKELESDMEEILEVTAF